jgi:hypothetical protein
MNFILKLAYFQINITLYHLVSLLIQAYAFYWFSCT